MIEFKKPLGKEYFKDCERDDDVSDLLEPWCVLCLKMMMRPISKDEDKDGKLKKWVVELYYQSCPSKEEFDQIFLDYMGRISIYERTTAFERDILK